MPVEDILARLRQLLPPLDSFMGSCEERMLVVGQSLSQARRQAGELTATATTLANSLDAPDLRDTIAGLDQAVEVVTRLCDARGERLAILNRTGELAVRMRRQLRHLRRAIEDVRFLGFNAKIEVSRMCVEHGNLVAFTRQIAALSSDGHRILDDMLRQLAHLEEAVGEALDLQRRFEDVHLRRLERMKARMVDSIAAMRERERDAYGAMRKLPADLEQAHGRIARLVTALQVGDNVRQRVEHVLHALRLLIDLLSDDGAETQPEHEPSVLVAVACDLQARQLGQSAQDLDAHGLEILADLDALAEAVAQVKADIAAACAGGSGDAATFFLVDVDRDLEGVAQVVGDYRRTLEAADRSALLVNRLASAIGEAVAGVREIDAQMSLLGLNASIQSGNIGTEGRALNTIAQELRMVAAHTRALSDATGALLEGMTAEANALQAVAAENDRQDIAGIESWLGRAAERLRAFASETSGVLAQIQVECGELSASLRDAARRFRSQQDQVDTLIHAADALADIGHRACPATSADDAELARQQLGRLLEKHYTTASERAVHDELLCLAPSSPTSAATPTGPAADEEDDLSDVLF